MDYNNDDQVFNRVIKQEIIDERDHNNDDKVFNRVIKQETIDDADYNDDKLLPKR